PRADHYVEILLRCSFTRAGLLVERRPVFRVFCRDLEGVDLVNHTRRIDELLEHLLLPGLERRRIEIERRGRELRDARLQVLRCDTGGEEWNGLYWRCLLRAVLRRCMH